MSDNLFIDFSLSFLDILKIFLKDIYQDKKDWREHQTGEN